MRWILAISIFLLGYTYVGYPLLMTLWAGLRNRPVQKKWGGGGVSILIVAHNEAETLPRKVAALLDLAKNEPIREICVGLDGCTDGTGDRVRKVLNKLQGTAPEVGRPVSQQPTTNGHQPILHMLEFDIQRGKAAVLNSLMEVAQEPIWVMMDARQRIEAGAILHLLENFADPQVGVVSGALVYEFAEGGAQKGADSYWGYEKHLRLCESRVWAVPGATGALYAIRKEFCRPIPENTLVDDVLIPMGAVLDGFRCLFEPTARVFDLPTDDYRHENLRKRRTLAGIWQIWRLEPKIYSIIANPIWFQWISHKFLRLLTPFFALLAYISLGFLAWNGPFGWKLLFLGASVCILSSFLACLGGRKLSSRSVGLLGAFWAVNGALLQAAWDALTGRFEARWKRGKET